MSRRPQKIMALLCVVALRRSFSAPNCSFHEPPFFGRAVCHGVTTALSLCQLPTALPTNYAPAPPLPAGFLPPPHNVLTDTNHAASALIGALVLSRQHSCVSFEEHCNNTRLRCHSVMIKVELCRFQTSCLCEAKSIPG